MGWKPLATGAAPPHFAVYVVRTADGTHRIDPSRPGDSARAAELLPRATHVGLALRRDRRARVTLTAPADATPAIFSRVVGRIGPTGTSQARYAAISVGPVTVWLAEDGHVTVGPHPVNGAHAAVPRRARGEG
jgi:hypothetical protein